MIIICVSIPELRILTSRHRRRICSKLCRIEKLRCTRLRISSFSCRTRWCWLILTRIALEIYFIKLFNILGSQMDFYSKSNLGGWYLSHVKSPYCSQCIIQITLFNLTSLATPQQWEFSMSIQYTGSQCVDVHKEVKIKRVTPIITKTIILKIEKIVKWMWRIRFFSFRPLYDWSHD